MEGLFRLPSGTYLPCGLSTLDTLWWKFMPGVIINVKWPKGTIKVGPSHRQGWIGIGEYFEYIESADPNDHYRPWLEEHVGQQGWDWNWGLVNNDSIENRLTIKIRQGKKKFAVIAAIRWA